MEEWRDIAGYEGLYQVSNLGRVRSLDRVVECVDSIRRYKGRILKQCRKQNGYMEVVVKRQCEQHFLVHRLVAQTFIPNPNGYPTVNHLDENKENNKADNLEWVTSAENNAYGIGCINRKKNAPAASIRSTARPVQKYSLEGKLLDEYYSAMEAGRANGCRQSGISECCNGKQKTAYGYIWKYKEVT
jgi:hypothetical protein